MKMIKIDKTTMLVVTIILISILIISRLYLQVLTDDKKIIFSEYSSQKEALLRKQLELQTLISKQNLTLNQEIIKQDNLSKQLSSLNPNHETSSGGSLISSNQTNNSLNPAPKPSITPVTRAS
jgi:hypothetical protein